MKVKSCSASFSMFLYRPVISSEMLRQRTEWKPPCCQESISSWSKGFYWSNNDQNILTSLNTTFHILVIVQMNNRWKTKHVETEMAQRLSTFFQRSPTDATKPPLARCGGMFWLFKRHLCLVRFANTLECEVGRLWEAAMCVGRFQHFTSAFLWNKESNRQIKLVKKNITLRISCRPKTNMADIQYGIYWNEIYRERSSSKAQIIFPGRLIFSHELQQNSNNCLFIQLHPQPTSGGKKKKQLWQ